MPKMLQAGGPLGKAGWAPFQTLLVAQLQFLEPYLRTARLHESVRLLYQVRPPRRRTACPPAARPSTLPPSQRAWCCAVFQHSA